MRRRSRRKSKLKLVLGIVAVLVVAVVVAGYAVLANLDVEQYRGTIEAEAKKATGRDLKLAGPIDLQISLTPAITAEDVSFANASWGSRPEMMTLKRFELRVALLPLLSEEVQVKQLVLVEPDILLETDKEGVGNWVMEGADGGAETGGGGIKLSFEEAKIEGGTVAYRDGQSGEELRVRLDELTGEAEGPSSPIAFTVTGSYNDQDFSADGTLGALAQLETGPFPLKLNAKAGGATIEVDGSLADPQEGKGLSATVSVKGEQLADLGKLAGAELPPLGAYELLGELQQDDTRYNLTGLSAKLGDSDLAGTATLDLGGARPAISGDLKAGLIDLAGLTAAAEGGETAGDGRYIFPAEPLPLDRLKSVDADLKLTASELRLQDKISLTDMTVTLQLKEGHLEVKPLTAKLSDGTIDAALDLNAAQAAVPVALTLKVDQLDYGKLLRKLDMGDTVAGTMDVNVDVTGAGDSPRAIASGLNGTAELVSNEGVVTNRLLKLVAVGLGDVLGPLLGSDQDAKLHCMIGRFAIKQGIATSEALVVATEEFTVSGGGSIDLRDETLDLQFDTATSTPSIASLAVPFNVTGPIASPSVAPDPIGTAIGLAKTAGLVLVPPVGIAALIGEQIVGSSGNPCVTAVDKAEKDPSLLGGAATAVEGAAEGAAGAVEDAAKGAAGAVEGAVEDVGEGLKNLFGD